MGKCLILLTSEYPFGKAETFIESEIEYHTKYFDKIIILSIDLNKNATQTRTLPKNIECFNIAKLNKNFGKISDVCLGVCNILKCDEYYKSDKSAIGGNPAKRVFHEYFCHRAKREYNYCKDVLRQYDFSQFDSIVIYSYWMFVSAFIGAKIKDNLSKINSNVKLITRCHGYDVYEERNSLNFLPMRHFILENCDTIFPCSDFANKYLTEKYPNFKNKFTTSHLGTSDNGERLFTKKIGELNILSCSNVVELKRIDKIISALSLLDNTGLKIKWVHIGDGKLRNDIITLATQKLHNIKFEFLGQLKNAEVYNYYKNNNIDLFINTSSSEGIPVSIMEAASFGTPIVATDVGGVAEIVKNDINGKLISVDFTDEFLAKIIEDFANTDTEKISAFRSNSRSIWERYYNSTENYNRFSEIISG